MRFKVAKIFLILTVLVFSAYSVLAGCARDVTSPPITQCGLTFSSLGHEIIGSTYFLNGSVSNSGNETITIQYQWYKCRCRLFLENSGVCLSYWPFAGENASFFYGGCLGMGFVNLTLNPGETKKLSINITQYLNQTCGLFQADVDLQVKGSNCGGIVLYGAKGYCTDCPEFICGDGIVNGGEECDGVNISGCDDNKPSTIDSCSNNCSCVHVCKNDEDKDCICDEDDKCIKSVFGEPVDENGCDEFQFCGRFLCGSFCEYADFIPKSKDCKKVISLPEPVNPRDCTTVIVAKEGIYFPKCVPITCSN